MTKDMYKQNLKDNSFFRVKSSCNRFPDETSLSYNTCENFHETTCIEVLFFGRLE